MQIAYTPDIFSSQRVGGISRYFCALLRGMREGGHDITIAAGLHFNEHLRELEAASGVYVSRLGPPRKVINEAYWALISWRHPRALVHETYYSDRNYRRTHAIVVTVYDMIDELMPARVGDPRVKYKRATCNRAHRIIAISNATKKDIVTIYGIEPEKIAVVPLASWLPRSPNLDQAGRRPYLLYVGARWDYKNFQGLAQAFAQSDLLRSRYAIKCFGGGAFNADECKLLRELGIWDQVEQQDGSDSELAMHYRLARALVYPSRYEGFGLPLLEAMSQGCPVFCSTGGSLPEIAGDAAQYFDAGDVASIRTAVESHIEDEPKLLFMAKRGAERERLFSWARCYRETLQVYEDAEAEHRKR